MIMNVETKFCKMFGQFRTIVKKLEKALENNTPIHQRSKRGQAFDLGIDSVRGSS